MGADGWITIYDADRITEDGLDDFFNVFRTGYEREIFGRKIYHVYNETERSFENYGEKRFITNNKDKILELLDDKVDQTNIENTDYLFELICDHYEIDTWEVWT